MILVMKQFGPRLRVRPILLITRVITDRIGLQSGPITIINHNYYNFLELELAHKRTAPFALIILQSCNRIINRTVI